MVTFIDLPEDLLLEILSHLPDQDDRLHLTHSCRRINKLLVPYVWRNILLPDLTVLDFLKNIVSCKDVIRFDQETKKNSQRFNSIFDITSDPLSSSRQNNLVWNYLSENFLKSIENQLVSPFLLQSVRQLEMSVNTKYAPSNHSHYDYSNDFDSVATSSQTNKNHFSFDYVNHDNFSHFNFNFSYICKNILKPQNFPSLKHLVLHYAMTHSFSTTEQACSEMKHAFLQIEPICKEFNQKITIDLINWLLRPLLENLDRFVYFPNCIYKLTVPKLDKSLPQVLLKDQLKNLNELSIGLCSSAWLTENSILEPRNFQAFQAFVSQLGSIKTLSLLGLVSTSNAINTIPQTVTRLDFPQNGLFGLAPPFPLNSSTTSPFTYRPLDNVRTLCIRLDNSSTKLPSDLSQIPFTNLESLTILHMNRQVQYSEQQLSDFYSVMFLKNPHIEHLCLDLIYIKSIWAAVAYCSKLKKLCLLNPTLYYSYPNSYDELMKLLAGFTTLESLKLHVLGASLRFQAMIDFIQNCTSLKTFLVIQECSKKTEVSSPIAESATSSDGSLSNLMTMANNSSESLTNIFSSQNDVLYGKFGSPEHFEDYDNTCTNQELLSDLLLIEESLQTLNNFNFDDIQFNQLPLSTDFQNDLDVDMETRQTSAFRQAYLHEGRFIGDYSAKKGFRDVQLDIKELQENLSTCMFESFTTKQKSYLQILEHFLDEPSMAETRYFGDPQTSYTVFQCFVSKIRQDYNCLI